MTAENRTTNDESNLRFNNFGGLNITTAVQALPYSDSSYLVNYDIQPTGKLVTRGGTRVVYKSQFVLSYADFTLSARLSAFIIKEGLDLVVSVVYNNEITILETYTDVFLDTEAEVNSIELTISDQKSILLLSSNNAPIQLFGHIAFLVNHTGTTALIGDASWVNIVGVYTVHVFVDSILQTGIGITYDVVQSKVSLTGLPSDTKDIDIVAFTWCWWAEAETWFGEDFFRGESRFGDAISDQHIQLPLSVRTDQEDFSVYPWLLYKTTNFNDKYTNVQSTLQPRLVTEYAFTDGINYEYDVSEKVNPAGLFATFGRNNFINQQLLLDINIDYTNDKIKLDGHEYEDFDAVKFDTGAEGVIFGGVSVGTTYWVDKLTDGEFQLHGNSTLTSLVNLVARVQKTFDNITDVDFSLSRLTITSHGFSNGDRVRIGGAGLLLVGLNNTLDYYVKSIDANTVELYFESELLFQIRLSPLSDVYIEASKFDATADTVDIGATSLRTGDRAFFAPGLGTLPAGISTNIAYYIKFVDITKIELYTNSILTVKVVWTGTATGVLLLRQFAGTMYLYISTGSVFLERVSFDKVYFVRQRELRFNNNTNISANNLYVEIDGVEKNLSISTVAAQTNTYRGWSNLTTEELSPGNPLKYLSFDSTPEIGIERILRVITVNKEVKWLGAAGSSLKYSLTTFANRGGWRAIYGLGRYADYDNGIFPTVALLFQGRLLLSGFENNAGLILFSLIGDSLFDKEFFNFFQITDALNVEDESINPFDINVVSGNQNVITSLASYQNSLFAFTSATTFRITGVSSSTVTVNNAGLYSVSRQGALNSNCVARTENGIFYLSSSGLFNVSLQNNDAENYFNAELSLAIKSIFNPLKNRLLHKLPWIMYSNQLLKIYIAIPEVQGLYNSRLFVYDLRTDSWTEYISYAGFETNQGLLYNDSLLGEIISISGRVLCNTTITRLNYSRQGDYVEVQQGASPTEGIPQVFDFVDTYDNVFIYTFDLYELPFTNKNSFKIVLANNLASITPSTPALDSSEWTRVYDVDNKLTVQLTNNPGNGKVLVVEALVRVTWIDNVETPFNLSDFDPRVYDDACALGT